MDPSLFLNEGEEAFLEDVEDSGKEEGQSQEDEQFVSQLSSVILKDQLPPQVDGSRHVFKLLIGFLYRPGGGGCDEEEKYQRFKRDGDFYKM